MIELAKILNEVELGNDVDRCLLQQAILNGVLYAIEKRITATDKKVADIRASLREELEANNGSEIYTAKMDDLKGRLESQLFTAGELEELKSNLEEVYCSELEEINAILHGIYGDRFQLPQSWKDYQKEIRQYKSPVKSKSAVEARRKLEQLLGD